MQRPQRTPAHHGGLCRPRLPQRARRIEVHKRIQLRLHSRHPFEMRLHNLDRRNSLLSNTCNNLRNRSKNYFAHEHWGSFQWAWGVGAFIKSTNILLNLAKSKSA